MLNVKPDRLTHEVCFLLLPDGLTYSNYMKYSHLFTTTTASVGETQNVMRKKS